MKKYTPVTPIAMPLLAGPGVLAYIVLHSANALICIAAILLAMTASFGVVWLSFRLQRFFSEDALNALERFMGFILAVIAIEMVIAGIRSLF